MVDAIVPPFSACSLVLLELDGTSREPSRWYLFILDLDVNAIVVRGMRNRHVGVQSKRIKEEDGEWAFREPEAFTPDQRFEKCLPA